MITLAPVCVRMYRLPVAANSVTDLGRSKSSRSTSSHRHMRSFFSSARYGGCAWDTSGYAGFLDSRSANPSTAITIIRLAANGDGSPNQGATPMRTTLTLNPSKSHASAWKARAFAALRADSSLSVRLRRYNEAMARARSLETVGGVQ